MPDMIIVAGPNGAGKTSFANEFFGSLSPTPAFVNADEVTLQLPADVPPERREMLAGRLMLSALDTLVSEGRNVVLETTLSSRGYAQRIPLWRSKGYVVLLVYLRLPSIEASIDRVRRRVAAGGHDIPERALRRRFARSLQNLDALYKPLVDEWYIWDSLEGDFRPAQAWNDT